MKDIGSNSGTFLNGKRLVEAGKESEAFEVKCGDLIQLGKDFVDEASGSRDSHGWPECMFARAVR